MAVVCAPLKVAVPHLCTLPLQLTPPHPTPITILPHFLGSGLWALRYVYLSRPNQPPPVDVSGTTAAVVQGCSGKWNPATTALMEKLNML